MERVFIRGVNQIKAAELLFSEKEDFSPEDYRKYRELEIVVQEDGRYSVWGNFSDDADLLQDTRKDPEGRVKKLMLLADEIETEE